jgi:Protein kinase domain
VSRPMVHRVGSKRPAGGRSSTCFSVSSSSSSGHSFPLYGSRVIGNGRMGIVIRPPCVGTTVDGNPDYVVKIFRSLDSGGTSAVSSWRHELRMAMTIRSQPNWSVFAIPADLQLSSTPIDSDRLNALIVPAGCAQTGMTVDQLLKRVVAMFISRCLTSLLPGGRDRETSLPLPSTDTTTTTTTMTPLTPGRSFPSVSSRPILITRYGGKSLTELRSMILRRPWDELARLCRSACASLQFLHEQCKLVHRDIKPDNLVGSLQKRSMRWIDFGAARSLQASDYNHDLGRLLQTMRLGHPYRIWCPELNLLCRSMRSVHRFKPWLKASYAWMFRFWPISSDLDAYLQSWIQFWNDTERLAESEPTGAHAQLRMREVLDIWRHNDVFSLTKLCVELVLDHSSAHHDAVSLPPQYFQWIERVWIPATHPNLYARPMLGSLLLAADDILPRTLFPYYEIPVHSHVSISPRSSLPVSTVASSVCSSQPAKRVKR